MRKRFEFILASLFFCTLMVSCQSNISENSENFSDSSEELSSNISNFESLTSQSESQSFYEKCAEDIVKEIYYNENKDNLDITLQEIEVRLLIEFGKYNDYYAAIIEDDINKNYGFEYVNGIFYYIYGDPIRIYKGKSAYDIQTAYNEKIISKEEVGLIYEEYLNYVNSIEEFTFQTIDDTIIENANIDKEKVLYYLGEYNGKHAIILDGDVPQVGFNKEIKAGEIGFLYTTLVSNLSFVYENERYYLSKINQLSFTDEELLELYNLHAYVVNKMLYSKQ